MSDYIHYPPDAMVIGDHLRVWIGGDKHLPGPPRLRIFGDCYERCDEYHLCEDMSLEDAAKLRDFLIDALK